jgi:hypothetical protein
MASERDLELLDDYIGNRLDVPGKRAFEQKLDADPELKSEYDFQQKIADGLRQARAAQLKAMLVALPTPPMHGSGHVSVSAKVSMWVAATAVVGAGIYFLLRSDEKTETSSTRPATEIHPDTQATAPQTTDSVDSPAVSAEQNTTAPSSTEKKSLIKKVAPVQKDSDNTNRQAEKPAINAFDPTEAEEQNTPVETVIEPSAKVSKEVKTPVETNTTSKKYTFHYQFTDGKIILYGPFEKELYEIMEFFGGTKQPVFLYHKNNYYLMTNDGDKIKPLVPVNDPKLLSKLKELRQKNND